MTVDDLLVGLTAFALRATVLLLGAWAATKLLRRASAATRHLIWTAAIAGVLCLPLLARVVPAWNVPIVPIAANVDLPLVASIPTPQPSRSAAPGRDIESSTPVTRAVVSPTESRPAAPSVVASLSEGLLSRITARGVATVAWLGLALLMLARLAVANVRVASWQRSSRPVEDGRWLTLLRRLTREYGIDRPVVLLEHGETDVPVTWGIVYPVVLLPATALGWDEEQRIAVLTHELAHVKRFDALSQMLGQLALALLWFHPLVWMAVRRMRLEREHACDDFVLVAGARASRYADDLLGLARRLTRPTAPAAAALAMARRTELEGRLLAILDPAMKRTAVRRTRVGLLTIAVVVLAVPLAAFRPAVRVATLAARERGDARAATQTPLADRARAQEQGVGNPRPARVVRESANDARELQRFIGRIGVPSSPTLEKLSSVPDLKQARTDTLPPPPIDVATLIAVTRAAKRMTSDYEKGQVLAQIVKRYQPVDSLRDAYLDAVFTMTSDYERTKALTTFLDRDSLPLSSTARILRSALGMTSDVSRGALLKRISPTAFADSAVQKAYLDVITGITSNTERASAIAALVKQRPLTPTVQLGLMRAIGAITSNTDKAGVMLLFVEYQGLGDETVRRVYFKTAESLTSDYDYRRVISAVMR